ncbi:MAG: isocitrate/isopropylmalate dehydrogenase family protein [Planctomycetes bacterium]|nr:isocitrate/isopropylmalate dehydrogenase family protein [Planctomycetota bacterium]
MSATVHKIAVIPGDGIGTEVVAEGVKVLEALRDARGRPLELLHFDLGADRYLRDGTTFPAAVRDTIRDECSAVLLGAMGDPRVPGMEHARDIIFGLRFGFDLYCNIRPVACLHDSLMPLKGRTAKDCDMVVFRENTEGVYVGMGGQFKRGTPDEVAINEDLNTRKGVERIIRAAFDYARRHGRRKVHVVDKSNAMRHAHELWGRVFREVATDYPELETGHQYVDAFCFNLIRDPAQFDVVVTCNLFGDIVTDLGASLQGGLGMAASANVRPDGVGMFEPVHGSAPDIAGQGKANPLATVLTVGMLMTHLGHADDEALLIECVRTAIDRRVCTADVGGDRSTREVGDFIVELVRRG